MYIMPVADDKKIVVDEPATLPGPAPYEEELKDYEHDGEEDLLDNLPDAHPEPKPALSNNS
jgi:hypothetical protein